MRKSIRLSLFIVAATLTVAAAAQTPVTQTDAQRAFAAIKNLPGTWEQKTPEASLQVSFKVVSAGSAVVSEITGMTSDHGNQDMITMFHMDRPDRLMMTHYCSAGNQPRLLANVSPDGKTITFEYLDATNLSAPDAGHMQRMVLTLLDDNHHTEEWTFLDHGKQIKRTFDLRRTM